MSSKRDRESDKRRAAKKERNRIKRMAASTGRTQRPQAPKAPLTLMVNFPGADGLARSGPIVVATWSVPTALAKILAQSGHAVPKPIVGHMLVDTGASKTCIADDVAAELGLKPVGRGNSFGAHGVGSVDRYFAHFRFSMVNQQTSEVVVVDRETLVDAVPKLRDAYDLLGVAQNGFPVRLIGLLGRDFLRHTKLIYDGGSGSFSMTLRLDGMKAQKSNPNLPVAPSNP